MYAIRLQNCGFFGRHGVLKEEEALGQRFFVDAELTVAADEALRSDQVEETVNYGEVFELIEKTVTGERFQLIEALAFRIGQRLMSEFPQVRRVEITVRKPSVPIAGMLDFAAVTVALP